MTARRSRAKAAWLSVILACVWPGSARADLIANGGFEAGFTAWTRVDQTGSEGTFFLQTGTSSPVNGIPVPAPSEGSAAAMTDAEGPGSHALYQVFFVSAPVPQAILSFDLFIGNRSDDFATPGALDFAIPDLNQQARVDVLRVPASGVLTDPFTISPADVLVNIVQTVVGDPLVSGYARHVVDLTALVNGHVTQFLALRFTEVDNVFIFQLGVDDVRLETEARSVSAPSASILVVSALLAGAAVLTALRTSRTDSRRRGTRPA